jgi:hypothetical protein
MNTGEKQVEKNRKQLKDGSKMGKQDTEDQLHLCHRVGGHSIEPSHEGLTEPIVLAKS